MGTDTSTQYDAVVQQCRALFVKKTHDYGTSWRILRTSSMVDQIFIKAQRIRSIEEKQEMRVDDPIAAEYTGIINYSLLALIQLQLGSSMEEEMDTDTLFSLYDEKAGMAKKLMEDKNHDYGEAWRQMLITSFTDLILSKLLRIRQIMQNKGKTLASEGIDANLYDMINYAIFALIRMEEQQN